MVKHDEITDPRIRDIIHEIDGGRVLDVGCVQHNQSLKHESSLRQSPNWLHQHLYDRADEVLGVDIDEEGIKSLQNSGYNVTFADAEVLDVDGVYDYIVAGELIEHLSNEGEFLSAAKNKLANNGQLIITTPNPWCWARMKDLIRKDGVPCYPEHTHYHDEKTLKQLLQRFGFSANIRFVEPMSEGISRRLYRTPITQLKRLGATQLLAVAEINK